MKAEQKEEPGEELWSFEKSGKMKVARLLPYFGVLIIAIIRIPLLRVLH